MKITLKQSSEIIKFLEDDKYVPDISSSLVLKAKSFHLLDNLLFFKNKIVIVKEEVPRYLTIQFKKFPFGRDKIFKTLQS